MPITDAQLNKALETIAPTGHAEEWDNVGILIKGVRNKIDRVLLTIDLTEPVLAEAVDSRADAIIAYHPPIFSPLERISGETLTERLVLGVIRAGMHLYSPHTALDAAPGGVNDWLADSLDEGDRRALTPVVDESANDMCKIVTYCPPEAATTIRDGLAAVGAGTIGEYKRCSFESSGAGTFHASNSSNPSVGKTGRLERVSEMRLEMVCPKHALAGAVRAMRSFHPYEEPPIDIYKLEPVPLREIGAGRRVMLDRAVSLRTIIEQVRSRTNVQRVKVARAHERPQKNRIIGLCVGAGGSLLDNAIAQGCTVFITGEMRHHDILRAQASGCSVILAGHTNTERGYLPILGRRLSKLIGEAAPLFIVSRKDRDPLRTP
jgi:dinuclear metal center YbgI/SA1388 family protein